MKFQALSTFTFPSQENTGIRYVIDTGCSAQLRWFESSSISAFGSYFETLGDGNTQHTPCVPVGMRHLEDFCLSLLAHLWAEETDLSVWNLAASVWPRSWTTATKCEWYKALRYSADVRIWVNLTHLKKSKDSDKQHDSRWIQLPEWADGSSESVIRFMEIESKGAQVLQRIVAAIQMRHVHSMPQSKMAERYCLVVHKNDWCPTFEAIVALGNAFEGITQAVRTQQSWENLKRYHATYKEQELIAH